MRRIFYFSGHRLTVFHWTRKTLAGACSFESNDEGYEKFRQYLESSAKTSTRMLVDVIEEDFRKDVIPHVHGADKKAVISRLIDRYYRSSRQYTYSEVQGRQKHGRKDDEVLLAAITNPELVRAWIRIIEECDVPLSGIWSLPLISKSILPVIGAKKGYVLLVSQQVNSNLRQTFFKDGKMVSSRQSVINQDAKNISNIGQHARPEIERTLTFIRNQYQLEDEVINVHILGSDTQIDSLESVFVSDQTNGYHIHRIKDVNKKLGIKELPDKFADGLFAWMALNGMGTTGHYGRREEFNRFYYALASSALYASSVAVILVSMLMTESNISDGISFKESSALLQDRTVEFKRVYEKKYQAYEELFSNANLMDAAVGLVGQIETNSEITPLDFMVVLSKLINSPQVGRIYLDKIEWTTRQIDNSKRKKARKNSKKDELYKPTVATSDGEIQHVAVVTGRLPFVTNNYRSTVDQVNNIITSLSSSSRVAEISAINLPVDVRPDKKFSSETRTLAAGESDIKEDKDGLFSLQIVMKSPDHV